jgi:hypothetical protein
MTLGVFPLGRLKLRGLLQSHRNSAMLNISAEQLVEELQINSEVGRAADAKQKYDEQQLQIEYELKTA